MQTVPLKPLASQSLKIVLGGQNVQLLVYQKPQGLFIDINSDGIDIVTTVICRDIATLVCRDYVGFIGNLAFIDTQGSSDPDYTGLGSRFQLIYFTAAENDIISG